MLRKNRSQGSQGFRERAAAYEEGGVHGKLKSRRNGRRQERQQGPDDAIVALIKNTVAPAAPTTCVRIVVGENFLDALENAQAVRFAILIRYEYIRPTAAHLFDVFGKRGRVGQIEKRIRLHGVTIPARDDGLSYVFRHSADEPIFFPWAKAVQL